MCVNLCVCSRVVCHPGSLFVWAGDIWSATAYENKQLIFTFAVTVIKAKLDIFFEAGASQKNNYLEKKSKSKIKKKLFIYRVNCRFNALSFYRTAPCLTAVM